MCSNIKEDAHVHLLWLESHPRLWMNKMSEIERPLHVFHNELKFDSILVWYDFLHCGSGTLDSLALKFSIEWLARSRSYCT